MIPEGLLEQYVSFFRGRSDVYGGWDGFMVKEPLTPEVFRKHLTTGPFIGVYPSMTDLTSWGAIDIDGKDFPIACERCAGTGAHVSDHLLDDQSFWETENCANGCYEGSIDGCPTAVVHDWGEMFILARNLQTILASAGVSAHIERTRNGFHVWVFPQEPLIKAATMSRALRAVCAALDYDPKEVNPKQEKVGRGSHVKYGNYVRLPYYGWFGDNYDCQPDRYMVNDSQEAVDLAEWMTYADGCRADTNDLEQLAALWTPPQRELVLDTSAGMEAANILPYIDGLAYRIWEQGPLEGSDRSQTLAKLAHKLRDGNTRPEAALVVMRSANARWGKWHDNPEHAEEQLRRMVENAYG